MRPIGIAFLGLALCFGTAGASAEPMVLDVVVSPKDQINLDFKDDKRHFVILMQREGTASGKGVFEGAKVFEYGFHDVNAGKDAMAIGYFEATTTAGDSAYFRWRLEAKFVAGPDGKAKPVNSGLWELSGGTGQFANKRGVGSLVLEFVNKTDRRFILEGDISPAP